MRVLIIAATAGLLLTLPGSLGAAKESAEMSRAGLAGPRFVQVDSTPVRTRVNVRVLLERVAAPAVRVVISAGRLRCSVPRGGTTCVLRKARRGAALTIVGVAVDRRGHRSARAIVRYIAGAGPWRPPAPGRTAPSTSPAAPAAPELSERPPDPRGCTIIGDGAANVLRGTAGRDVICGFGGDDVISGNGGGDLIYGDAGADTIYAGSAVGRSNPLAVVAVRVVGLGGGTIDGGEGDDAVFGSPEPEVINGSSGADTVEAGGGDDVISGGPDDDFLLGQAGFDTIDGGAGLNRCDRDSGEPLEPTCFYDTAAPALVSMSFAPSSVDTSTGSKDITVQARITDDLVGPAGPGYTSSPSQVRFTNAATGQNITAMFESPSRVSGDAQDGVYEDTITLPYGAAQGTWTATSFLLVDQVGNSRTLWTADMTGAGIDTDFVQTGVGDAAAPQLVSMSISPTRVDTAGSSQEITVEVRVTDDLTGPAGPGYTSSPSQVRFTHGPTGQNVTAMFESTSRISGDARDGIYRASMTLPMAAANGTWTATSFLLVDQVGNSRNLGTSDMATAGFPTTFING
jgi:hypothetical protein